VWTPELRLYAIYWTRSDGYHIGYHVYSTTILSVKIRSNKMYPNNAVEFS